jgi:REP element-mobilizing transposase RayT
MGRPSRPNIPGAVYHVMNRGNRKAPIFEDRHDRLQFVRTFEEQMKVFEVKLLAADLMGNHFHAGVLTPHGNLSDFMRQLQGQFARYSNWRHGRVGHLFQGRFRHVLVENDVHLLTMLCYIFMNPVAAGLVSNIEDYKWSTFPATVGLAARPAYLSMDWLQSLFPTSSLPEAQQRFQRLMSEPRPVRAYLRDSELNLAPEAINQVIRSYTGQQLQIASLPRLYRTALRPSIHTLKKDSNGNRCQFIKEARISFGYRNVEIAKVLGLQPATVSKIFCACLRRG